MVSPLLRVKSWVSLLAFAVLRYDGCSGESEQCQDPGQCHVPEEQQHAKRRASAEALTRNSAGLTRLHFAAAQSDIKSAQQLLQNGALVDAQSNSGNSPLHIACQEGHVEMAGFLLKSGSDLELRAAQGITPLYLAAQKNQPEVVRFLLKSGAAINAATDTSYTPLHIAALQGNTKVSRILLRKGAVDVVNAPTYNGETPLHLVARHGKELSNPSKMVNLLLASRAAAEIQDSTGCTPLHLAAHVGVAEIVRVLLEHGAKANSTSIQGLTPIDLVVYGTPPDPEPLVELASFNTISVLTSFSGSVSTIHPWTGQTSLHVMAYLGLDKLAPPEATKDFRFYLQRGDGIETRLTRANLLEQERAQLEAFETAIHLQPTSLTAHMRMGTARARLRASSKHRAGLSQQNNHSLVKQEEQAAQQNEILMLDAFRKAWQLHPEHFTDAEEFARKKAELALIGWKKKNTKTGGVAPHIEAVSQITVRWETPAQHPAAMRRALNLWRRQGVVVFGGLLNETIVQSLRQVAEEVLVDTNEPARPHTVDRSLNIQAADGRTLRAMPVKRCTEALTVLSMELAPFLAAALGDASQLLLEIGAYRAAPGAASQDWHRDNPVQDLRIASMQIALGDTQEEQAALEVRPGTHRLWKESQQRAVTAAVAPGSVVLYSPFLMHRGRANTLSTERLAVVATLLSASSLVPNGIPLVLQPEDAGRWWLVDGELQDHTR